MLYCPCYFNQRKNQHMDMQTSVITCFKKYITIKGRASLSEFWWFILFNLIIYLFLNTIVIILYKLAYELAYIGDTSLIMYHEIASIVPAIWYLLIVIPITCAYIRRLHDINRSGWWYLFTFIPLIGWITSLVFLSKKGTAGDNRFGADPLAE